MRAGRGAPTRTASARGGGARGGAAAARWKEKALPPWGEKQPPPVLLRREEARRARWAGRNAAGDRGAGWPGLAAMERLEADEAGLRRFCSVEAGRTSRGRGRGGFGD